MRCTVDLLSRMLFARFLPLLRRDLRLPVCTAIRVLSMPAPAVSCACHPHTDVFVALLLCRVSCLFVCSLRRVRKFDGTHVRHMHRHLRCQILLVRARAIRTALVSPNVCVRKVMLLACCLLLFPTPVSCISTVAAASRFLFLSFDLICSPEGSTKSNQVIWCALSAPSRVHRSYVLLLMSTSLLCVIADHHPLLCLSVRVCACICSPAGSYCVQGSGIDTKWSDQLVSQLVLLPLLPNSDCHARSDNFCVAVSPVCRCAVRLSRPCPSFPNLLHQCCPFRDGGNS